MIEFKLPSLGADMDQGTLLQWHVKPGDSVKRGQVVAVVDTTKAAVDVEIWQDGTVSELLVQPGEKVPVGTPLATLLAPGEKAATPATAAVASVPGKRRLVSPSARRRAKELGIDPEAVTGTGAQGSVTLADIETATPGGTVSTDRQKEMRRAIGAAMSRSKREIPHYYLAESIPMQSAMSWLEEHNASLSVTERLLPAALLLKAVALALQRTPTLNGSYRNEVFAPSRAVHTGVAISLRGGGLLAPALHDVAHKPLALLMRELLDLVNRARAGSLRSSEMTDASITVTNLGEQSAQTVFGVIYPPQVALVGFGSIAQRPSVSDGKLIIQPVLNATLAADHRVSDGHQGAIFLRELHELLQQPQALDQGRATPTISKGEPQ